jgi:hypothetical protein
LPKPTNPNLSAPFRAFSRLFKPREKPKTQTKLENKPNTQTISSDRGYRRKITQQNPKTEQQRKEDTLTASPKALTDTETIGAEKRKFYSTT